MSSDEVKSVLRLTTIDGDSGWYHLSVRKPSWVLRRIRGGEIEQIIAGDCGTASEKISSGFTVDWQIRQTDLSGLTGLNTPSIEQHEEWNTICSILEVKYNAGEINIASNEGSDDPLIIPTTRLRKFYEFLRSICWKHFHLAIGHGIAQYPKQLALLCQVSNKEFSVYRNSEPLLPRKRNKLPPMTRAGIAGTNDFVSILQNSPEPYSVHGMPALNFRYIEREVSPRRTTNANFATGESGKSSGTGGMDILLYSEDGNLPIIGEVKVGNDTNPFLALIQALTYAVELSTQNQLQRLRKWVKSVYNIELSGLDDRVDIYIISVEQNEDENVKVVKKIVEGLYSPTIDKILPKLIRRIVYLKASWNGNQLNFECVFSHGEV